MLFAAVRGSSSLLLRSGVRLLKNPKNRSVFQNNGCSPQELEEPREWFVRVLRVRVSETKSRAILQQTTERFLGFFEKPTTERFFFLDSSETHHLLRWCSLKNRSGVRCFFALVFAAALVFAEEPLGVLEEGLSFQKPCCFFLFWCFFRCFEEEEEDARGSWGSRFRNPAASFWCSLPLLSAVSEEPEEHQSGSWGSSRSKQQNGRVAPSGSLLLERIISFFKHGASFLGLFEPFVSEKENHSSNKKNRCFFSFLFFERHSRPKQVFVF